MSTNSKLIGVGLALMLLVFTSATVNTAARTDDEEETITGTVVAVDWNEDDEVSAVAIRTVTTVENPENEEEVEEVIEDYLVADNKKGKEMLELVDEEVEATGSIKTDEDGNKTIYVTAYRVIEPEEDEEEEGIN